MNTWGYLILIAALLVLTAFMIYARFAGRSREKSVHHAPSELATFALFPAPEVIEVQEEAPADPLVMDLKPFSEAQPDGKDEAEEAEESNYFDELQEAAAGLAMLMRSSPAQDRSEPVVFAPEEEAEESVEAGDEVPLVEGEVVEEVAVTEIEITETEEASIHDIEVEDEAATEPIEIDIEVVGEESVDLLVNLQEEGEESSPIAEAMDSMEALIEDGPTFEDSADEIAAVSASSEALEADPPKESTGFADLKVVLGEEVAEQFSRLDSDLDDLESLVQSIEDQLIGLDDFISAPVEEDAVSEAA